MCLFLRARLESRSHGISSPSCRVDQFVCDRNYTTSGLYDSMREELLCKEISFSRVYYSYTVYAFHDVRIYLPTVLPLRTRDPDAGLLICAGGRSLRLILHNILTTLD